LCLSSGMVSSFGTAISPSPDFQIGAVKQRLYRGRPLFVAVDNPKFIIDRLNQVHCMPRYFSFV
jgi:hypothetical protein